MGCFFWLVFVVVVVDDDDVDDDDDVLTALQTFMTYTPATFLFGIRK